MISIFHHPNSEVIVFTLVPFVLHKNQLDQFDHQLEYTMILEREPVSRSNTFNLYYATFDFRCFLREEFLYKARMSTRYFKIIPMSRIFDYINMSILSPREKCSPGICSFRVAILQL